MKSKVLILGASGMLGGSILRHFYEEEIYDVYGSVRSNEYQETLSLYQTVLIPDISNFKKLKKTISNLRPNFVINCIGIIKQHDLSSDYIQSIIINSLFPHQLASICKSINAKLIHFSTDCVFNGVNGNYDEKYPPCSNDIYGLTKTLGEINYDNHLTIRTSIIGHELKTNVSLVDWFLNQKHSVNGYNKAYFSGLATIHLAEILHNFLLDEKIYGLYHLSSVRISKYELLLKIKEKYNKEITINKSSSVQIDRSLNSERIQKKYGISIKTWDDQIEMMHKEYTKYFNLKE